MTETTETLSPAIPSHLETEVAELLKIACDRGIALSTAESCTAGLLATLLTDIVGSSHAFGYGFVTYSDEAKTRLLGVPSQLIARHGAVSKEVAIAMAEGGIAQGGADLCLAITGFAGPALEEQEEGLVHLACAARDGRPTLHREEHFGDVGRGRTRVACLCTAVAMLREALDRKSLFGRR